MRSFSAVTRLIWSMYNVTLADCLAKDSARTSISSPVRYTSSIMN